MSERQRTGAAGPSGPLSQSSVVTPLSPEPYTCPPLINGEEVLVKWVPSSFWATSQRVGEQLTALRPRPAFTIQPTEDQRHGAGKG